MKYRDEKGKSAFSSQKYSSLYYFISHQSGTAGKLICLLHSKTVIQKKSRSAEDKCQS